VLPSFRGQLVGEWAQQVFPRLIANSLHSRLIQDKNAHAYGGGRKTGKTLISLTIVAIKVVLGLHTYSRQAAGLIEMHGKVKSFR